MQPITQNIVLITGFRQRHGRATTGLDALWHRIHSEIAGPASVVWLRSWDDDFRALAAQVNRNCMGFAVEVKVAAYSWGVGHGAVTLARELDHYGIAIETLFSIDGVYRHWLPVRSLFSRWNPLAPRIVIPHNVRETIYWRQTKSRPMGHELIAEVPGKQIIRPATGDGICPGYRHQTIDNNPVIHDEIVGRMTE